MKYTLNGLEVSRKEWLAGAPGVTPGHPPGCVTDATFLSGNCNGSQFAGQEHVGDAYAEEARARGVSVKGKVYKHSLARYPGDPEAWIDSRGDVKRICEKRGWHCEGMVKVKGAEMPPPDGPAIAPDIVERLVNQELAKDPEQNAQDVAEKVVKKHAPHWTRKGLKRKKLIRG